MTWILDIKSDTETKPRAKQCLADNNKIERKTTTTQKHIQFNAKLLLHIWSISSIFRITTIIVIPFPIYLAGIHTETIAGITVFRSGFRIWCPCIFGFAVCRSKFGIQLPFAIWHCCRWRWLHVVGMWMDGLSCLFDALWCYDGFILRWFDIVTKVAIDINISGKLWSI